MDFSHVCILSLSAMLMACGGARAVARQGLVLDAATSTARARPSSAETVTSTPEQKLQTGDYVVYRFSGSFRKASARYRVRVGKHEATMSTVASAAFPWGDVAGDITTL